MTTSDFFLKKARKTNDDQELLSIFSKGLSLDDDMVETLFFLTEKYKDEKRLMVLSDIIALFSDEALLEDLNKEVWDGIRDLLNEMAGSLELDLISRIMQEHLKRFPI